MLEMNHSKCNILIVDPFPSEVINKMKSTYNVVYDPSLSGERLVTSIKNVNTLIVTNKVIDENVINFANSLSLIVRMGPGAGKIDMKCASSKGVIVCNTPHSFDYAITELILGHIIACDRHIVQNTEHLRLGEWRQKFFLQCNGLYGRTLGIIGSYCRETLINFVKPMNMNVLTANTIEDAIEIASKCDVISINIEPSDYETISNIKLDQTFFDQMKEGSIFVNVTCSEVINFDDLKSAIDKKDIQVGLDVFSNESKATVADFLDTELAQLISSGTSHIGHSTKQSILNASNDVLSIIDNFIKFGKIKNCINLHITESIISYVIRHRGVLTKIIQVLDNIGVEIQEMSNYLIQSDECQCLIIKFSYYKDLSDVIKGIDGVIGVGKV